MLHHYGFGGILADDMGLGKTLQTIVFLTSQVTEDSRVLILAPSGLIYNWADEFRKFAPQLDLLSFMVWKRIEKRFFLKIIKSMWLAMPPFVKTASFIKRWFWFLFLDEAQVMKNAQTKIAQSLRQFVVPAVFAFRYAHRKPFRRVVVYLSNCAWGFAKQKGVYEITGWPSRAVYQTLRHEA